MARIADEELERLKAEVSVERLVEAKGVALKRHGKDRIGLCPFHADREPSLVVTPSKNLWHCLGACQTGGTAIDWVMKSEGVSFRHAVELLQADHPSLVAPLEGDVVKKSSRRALAGDFELGGDGAALLARVRDFYHRTLLSAPEGLSYLEERGLRDEEMVAHFKLGLANRTLGYRLPARTRKAGALLRTRLAELGVLRPSGHEHLSGSLVVPVEDASGEVVQLYGRKIGERLRKGTPLHLYLPGPHRGVFNLAGWSKAKEVILCESLLDALSFWSAGFRHVTASYGVEGFTAAHREALVRHGIERVLIAYDRDAAGDRAAAKLGAELGGAGMSVFRVLFPKGMDANAYAQKVTPAKESLALALRRAEWLAGVRAVQIPSGVPASPLASSPSPLSPSSPSSPSPSSPSLAASASVTDDEVVMRFGDRKWRVRGLSKSQGTASLKVNLFVGREDGSFHVDTLELYAARYRGLFLKMAAAELGVEERVLKRDLGRVLLGLEELVEQRMREAAEPKGKRPAMSDAEREAALALLRDPKLLTRVAEDLSRCGLVGERTNKLVAYLSATSRKLDDPLAVVIQSSSAAGKSSLMEAVLSFVPEEERVQYSAMTGQSLFYMSESDLKHKVLAIVEEEGAERASYALKLLQSEGELTIASTGKDPTTGRLVTQEYRVEGPVMIMLTTTAIEIDEELLNRCMVLSVDEGRAQTRAIHEAQRKSQTLAGMLARRDREHIVRLHRNAQRLLEPVLVVNPFAESLSFTDHKTRTRRDHMKYLTLIRTVALLCQHQRDVKTVQHRGEVVRYIEVTEADIGLADELCAEVMRRSLDELPPQTRRLLGVIEHLVVEVAEAQGVDASDVRFSRRDVRQRCGWSHTQVRVHMQRLEELEYLQVLSGGPRRRLVYSYDPNWAGSARALGGGVGRAVSVKASEGLGNLVRLDEVHGSGDEKQSASYPQPQVLSS